MEGPVETLRKTHAAIAAEMRMKCAFYALHWMPSGRSSYRLIRTSTDAHNEETVSLGTQRICVSPNYTAVFDRQLHIAINV